METVKFDEKNRIIEIHHGIWGPYYIPLDEALTPAEVGDWLRHVGEKTWGPAILPELAAMFRRVAEGA